MRLNRPIIVDANALAEVPLDRLEEAASRIEAEQEPVDVFGGISFATEPKLTPDMLPKAIADAAVDESQCIGVILQSVAMNMLAVCASVLHDEVCIQPKLMNQRWTESARIWPIQIAEVSGKKTPAMRAATWPLDELQAQLSREDEARLAAYETAHADWKAGRAHRSQRIKDGGKHLADSTGAVDEAEPAEPRRRRLYVNEATVEALGEILGENGRGVLVRVDEVAGYIAGFDAYRSNGSTGKDRALHLELYDGGPKRIDRIGRGSTHCPHWSACVIGNIQPDKLRDLAPKLTNDGFMQRALLYFGGRDGMGLDRAEDPAALTAYGALVRRLYATPPRRFLLDLDAQEWRERAARYTNALMALPTTPAALRGHLGKWEGMFARLCLLFHVIEGDGGRYVGAETAERVFRLMKRFLLPSAMAAYGRYFGHGEAMEHVRWIAGHMLAHPELPRLTRAMVEKSYRAAKTHPEIVDGAMGVLCDLNWAEADTKGGWVVNQRVHALWAERGKAERERRQRIYEAIGQAQRTVEEEAQD
jgi:hypothetical protein